MSFGKPSWIAAALLHEDVAHTVTDVRSEMVLYGSTAGPIGDVDSISGSAMSYFQMTLICLPEYALVFADDTLLGWADFAEQDARWRIMWRDLPHNKDRIRERLKPAHSCPIALRY